MTITDEILEHIAGEPLKRQQTFATRRKIYDAEMRAPLVDPDTKQPNKLDNIIVPAARNIVDDHVAALFGDDITFDVSEAYGDEAQVYAQRLWDDNLMPTQLVEWGMNGSICGSAGFKFEPDATDVRNGEHEWVVFDPAYLDVAWDPHNVKRVLLYRFEYPTIGEDENGKTVPFVWRQDIRAVQGAPDRFGRQRIESWTIANFRAKAPLEHGVARDSWIAMRQLTKWEPQGDAIPWPHRWAPVFCAQNLVQPNSWWGYSDIEAGVVALIESLNRALSNIAKTVRHHGHPTTIIRGGEWPEDTSIGTPVEFPGAPDEVDVSNLEMQSDLAAALELYRELTGEVYQAGSIPDVARGKLDNVGQLSGAALRILYGPMLNVLAKKRRTYGNAISAAIRCALEYAGFQPLNGASPHVTIVWPNPLPVNEKEEAETAEIDQRLGASQRTTLERRGYDPDQEADNRLEEGRDDPGMRGMADLIDGGALPGPGAVEEPAQPIDAAE